MSSSMKWFGQQTPRPRSMCLAPAMSRSSGMPTRMKGSFTRRMLSHGGAQVHMCKSKPPPPHLPTSPPPLLSCCSSCGCLWSCAECWIDEHDLCEGDLPNAAEAWAAYEGTDEHQRCQSYFAEWGRDEWEAFRCPLCSGLCLHSHTSAFLQSFHHPITGFST